MDSKPHGVTPEDDLDLARRENIGIALFIAGSILVSIGAAMAWLPACPLVLGAGCLWASRGLLKS